jgi:uncharacterized protein YcfL
MYSQIRQYTIVGVVMSTIMLVACNHHVDQPKAKQQDKANQVSASSDIEALSVIEAASAMQNTSERKAEEMQALQVEPHVLKHYAGRYDKAN